MHWTMRFVSVLRPAPVRRPGKQNRPCFGLRGSTVAPSARLGPGVRPLPSQAPARAENRALGTAYEAAAGFYASHGFVRLPDSPRLVLPMRLADGSAERHAEGSRKPATSCFLLLPP